MRPIFPTLQGALKHHWRKHQVCVASIGDENITNLLELKPVVKTYEPCIYG